MGAQGEPGLAGYSVRNLTSPPPPLSEFSPAGRDPGRPLTLPHHLPAEACPGATEDPWWAPRAGVGRQKHPPPLHALAESFLPAVGATRVSCPGVALAECGREKPHPAFASKLAPLLEEAEPNPCDTVGGLVLREAPGPLRKGN